MAIAYLYARFSTKRQQDGDSLTRQTLIAKQWCENNGYQLSEQTFEDLGVSAFKEGTRAALADFITAVETGYVARGSVLLIEDHDRLSRQGWQHTMRLIHDLVGLGVEVVVTKTGTVYNETNINDLSQNILLMFSAERAYQESKRKSDLIRASRTRARENRKVTGKLPMWVKRGDSSTGFVFNEFEQCIRELVLLRSKGKSMQSVAKELNANGFVTSTGAAWSASGVRAIIENHALYGCKQWFDTDVKTGRMNRTPVASSLDVFPALISFDEWQQLQQGKNIGKIGRVSQRGAFSGVLRCGLCGGALTQRTTTYRDKTGKANKRLYRKCVRATEGSCKQVELVREPEVYLVKLLSELSYKNITKSSYISKTAEIKQQIQTLTETSDILIKSGQSNRLALLYTQLGELEDQLEASLLADTRQESNYSVEYKNVFDVEVEEQNLILRKLLKSITFTMLSKVKTETTWKVIIEQVNGYKINSLWVQKHGFGNTEVKLVSNGEKLAKWIKDNVQVEDFD